MRTAYTTPFLSVSDATQPHRLAALMRLSTPLPKHPLKSLEWNLTEVSADLQSLISALQNPVTVRTLILIEHMESSYITQILSALAKSSHKFYALNLLASALRWNEDLATAASHTSSLELRTLNAIEEPHSFIRTCKQLRRLRLHRYSCQVPFEEVLKSTTLQVFDATAWRHLPETVRALQSGLKLNTDLLHLVLASCRLLPTPFLSFSCFFRRCNFRGTKWTAHSSLWRWPVTPRSSL